MAMFGYWNLLKTYPRYLTYGILHTFFSGYGQTFLFAVFVTAITQRFDISATGFGGMYAAATIISAFLLPVVGSAIDRINLRVFSLSVGATLCLACFLMGLADNIYTLFVGLFLLRHAGQALMTHISVTSVARYFTSLRGKALGISNLGFPFSEGVLPLLTSQLLLVLDWQVVFLLLGGLCLVLFMPLSAFYIPKTDAFLNPALKSSMQDDIQKNSDAGHSRSDVLRSPYFYFILPVALAGPFLLTGFIFYQASIAELKGWSLQLIASSFVVFAIFRVSSALALGPLIDKFSARQLLPFYMLPLVAGLICLNTFDHELTAFVYMAFCGITVGSGTSVKSAIWAEVYGTKHLGAIRSMTSPIVVISTAVAPLLFGWLFDHGLTLTQLCNASHLLILVTTILALLSPKPRDVSTAHAAHHT